MSTKDIRVAGSTATCDVCGRTLLRGEGLATYLNGGARRSVCELCEARVMHEGWVREGTAVPVSERDAGSQRRTSVLGRLRKKRSRERAVPRPSLADELDGRAWADAGALEEGGAGGRAPRHVRAVPTGDEQKVAAAITLFNGSEHRRTLAGLTRSLGEPVVGVLPSPSSASAVELVVSWELCWYRYEVDLSDDQPTVRMAAQGAELEELTAEQRQPTARADAEGTLTPLT